MKTKIFVTLLAVPFTVMTSANAAGGALCTPSVNTAPRGAIPHYTLPHCEVPHYNLPHYAMAQYKLPHTDVPHFGLPHYNLPHYEVPHFGNRPQYNGDPRDTSPRFGYYQLPESGWRWDRAFTPHWYSAGVVLPAWSASVYVPAGYWQCIAFNEGKVSYVGMGSDMEQAAFSALYKCGGYDHESSGCYIPDQYCRLR